ncbi:hypothetical protein [Sphingomonas sp.]|uniref:hypothetical protein n=1 Tax=Sphingomonas sp. TaxID=28214 RepID=UPI002B5FA400|nr:hypothetical protein [Sphingomonas sp.]HTG39500.1 hypothetical protein [Sphingomonas sp.]
MIGKRLFMAEIRITRGAMGVVLALTPFLGPVTTARAAIPAAQTASPSVVDLQVGRTGNTSAGQIGRRQTRTQAAREVGAQPMARINNRIPNRIQSRLRNRIDRNYDPQANAVSPFIAAEERTQTAGRPR